MEILHDINDFLNKSPTDFHFASNVRRLLINRKFTEIEDIFSTKDLTPPKGFLMLKRKMIIMYEIGDSEKSIVVTTSNKGKNIKIIEDKIISENESLKYVLPDAINRYHFDEHSIRNTEFFLAGSIIQNNGKQHLFQSDEPIGIYQKDSVILSIPEPTLNLYLENLVHRKVTLDKPDEIQKDLYLVPKSPSSNNFILNSSESMAAFANLSTFGLSFLALKSFLLSSSTSFNKFICIIPDDEEFTKEYIHSCIDQILHNTGHTLSNESIAINLGGIESSWKSHQIVNDHQFLSNGIVIQNLINPIILDQLDKNGIPYHIADDLPLNYSINDIQNVCFNDIPPSKLSLPLFNQNGISEFASISDINNLLTSLSNIFKL